MERVCRLRLGCKGAARHRAESGEMPVLAGTWDAGSGGGLARKVSPEYEPCSTPFFNT